MQKQTKTKKSNTPFHGAPNGPQGLAASAPPGMVISSSPSSIPSTLSPKHRHFPTASQSRRGSPPLSCPSSLRPADPKSSERGLPCPTPGHGTSCRTAASPPGTLSTARAHRAKQGSKPILPGPPNTASSGKPPLIIGAASDCSLLSTPGRLPDSPK